VTAVVAWAAAAILGGAGALLRFRLEALVELRGSGAFPLGTLVVNLLGAFLLGLLTGLSVGGDALLIVGTGLLGSFTTFSTVMLETDRLGEEGEGRIALMNIAVSFGCGLAAALAGWILGAAL
jgi:fluoride exporter